MLFRSQNTKLYIGLYASGLEINKPQAWKTPNELVRQMNYNNDCPEIEGALFYSARYFLKNIQGLQDSLKTTFYKYPALVPAHKCYGDDKVTSQPSNLRLLNGNLTASLIWDEVKDTLGKQGAYYVVYAFPKSETIDFDNPKNILTFTKDTNLEIGRAHV